MTDAGRSNAGQLPVSEPAEVRRAARLLIRQDRGVFVAMVALNALATVAALAGPWLLGHMINAVESGGGTAIIDRLAVAFVGFALLQLVLTRYARYMAARFGERTAARIRERFLRRVLGLQPSVVERVRTGDLIARSTSDVVTVSATMRDAAPDILIAGVQAAALLIAVFVVNPVLGLCGLAGVAIVWIATRLYVGRAREAYLASGAANSLLAETLTATATGARTVEALGLQQRRIRVSLETIENARRHRMRSLFLRSLLYPTIDVSYVVPVVGVLVVGGLLYDSGAATLGSVVAAALYLRQLAGPLETLELWIDQLQSSGASFARVEGLSRIPPRPPSSTATPSGAEIELDDVRYAYDGDRDVLHGVDLAVRPGERLAVVGPSGAGKSTLGRLLAGIEEPRTGSVTVGGVPVARLDPDRLREQIVLVTQEHHVFRDSVRDNLRIARPAATDAELIAALAAVGAEWMADLPAGLDTELGPDAYRLDPAQAQQLALSRVVLADPHTLVLDEATAMLDPTTARRTEQALSAVLAGRTVLAIAHRLHTAHDADRVAVLEAGLLTEVGRHADLVAGDGTYAALWRSWHGGEAPREPSPAITAEDGEGAGTPSEPGR